MTEVCAAKCPHGTVTCHLDYGHGGGHESFGPPSAGHRPNTACRWEK